MTLDCPHFRGGTHTLVVSSVVVPLSVFRRKKWWQIVTPVNSSLRHPSHVYEVLPVRLRPAASQRISLVRLTSD